MCDIQDTIKNMQLANLRCHVPMLKRTTSGAEIDENWMK
jgi:hypothetical protein